MGDLISRQAAIDALEIVAKLFPWRVPGNRDSYDSYNEAWNDAIGRAEIEIEELASEQPGIDEWCHDCKEYDPQKHCCPRWNRVIRETVKELKSEQPEQRWIPVSERLPEKNGVYIVSYEDAVTWLEWFNGKWFFYPSNPAREETGTIIAWMPLPEPYKEGAEE